MNSSNYNIDSLIKYINDILFEQPIVCASGYRMYKLKNIFRIGILLVFVYIIYNYLKLLNILSDTKKINHEEKLILRRKKVLFMMIIVVMLYGFMWDCDRGVSISFDWISICIILYILSDTKKINHEEKLILRPKKVLFMMIIVVMLYGFKWDCDRGVNISFDWISICIILYALYLI